MPDKSLYKLLLCFLIAVTVMAQPVGAQLPVIKTSVDKSTILIGEQIQYRAEVIYPAEKYRLTWLTVPEDLEHFTLVTLDKPDTSQRADLENIGQKITLTSFDSGRQVIPPFKIEVNSLNNDSAFVMFTDSIAVNVGYSPTDSIQPFHDIKSIIEVKKETDWRIWALIAAGVILFALLAWYLVKRYRKKKQHASLFESKLSPLDEALQALGNLKIHDPFDQKEIKEFHIALSQIVKRFLSRKSNMNKMHLTTDDLLVDIAGFEISRPALDPFAQALRLGNAVKFAQYLPGEAENEKSRSQVREVIETIDRHTNKKPEDAV